MKKDRSNHSSPSNRSLGLPRELILRGRTNFQHLFEEKSAVTFYGNHIKIRFCIFNDDTKGCKMGFVVAKKLGKANRRNRAKRLMREAYRLNQHALNDKLTAAQKGFHGVLMVKTIDFDFSTAETEVIRLLDEVQTHIHLISES